MKQQYSEREVTLLSLCVFIVASVIYGWTTHPTVASWDSAELTLGVYTQGIVHATGYPFYLVAARSFSYTIPGEIAFRVNLFSAAMGAATLGLMYYVNCRMTQQRWAALLSVYLFGFGVVFWSHATVAEVYTLHTALVASLLLLVERWQQSQRKRWLWWSYLIVGLMLSHHASSVLVVAVVLPYLWMQSGSRFPHGWGLLLMLAMPLIFYTYLGWRYSTGPDFNLLAGYFNRDLTQPGDMWWMIRGAMFEDAVLAYSPIEWGRQLIRFVIELNINFVGIGFLIGIVGMIAMWRQRRQWALMLFLLFLLQVAFFTSYNVFDKWQMFHTAYLIWGIFVAVGIKELSNRYSQNLVGGILSLSILLQFTLNYNMSGKQGDYFVERQTIELMEALPSDVLLVGPWTTLRPVEYYQFVHGIRPDIRTFDYTLLALGIRDAKRFDPALSVSKALSSAIDCDTGEVFIIAPLDYMYDIYQLQLVNEYLYRVQRISDIKHSECNHPAAPAWDRSTPSDLGTGRH